MIALLDHRGKVGRPSPHYKMLADGKDIASPIMGIMTLDAKQLKILFLFLKERMAGQVSMGGDCLGAIAVMTAQTEVIAACG